MELSEIGKIAEICWYKIPNHFPFVKLDEFVVMPDHIHGIIIIDKNDDDHHHNSVVETQNFASPQSRMDPQSKGNKFGPQSKNLGSIVRGYKVGVKKYATKNAIDFEWQSKYHDHIIRDNGSFVRIAAYIKNNPMKWSKYQLSKKK